jgi:hypothetical protein
MSSVHAPSDQERVEQEGNLTTEEDGDLDHVVDEVCTLVLAASSASEAAEPIVNLPESELEAESDEDDSSFQAPTIVSSTTRSGRVTRLSSRYSGANWLSH